MDCDSKPRSLKGPDAGTSLRTCDAALNLSRSLMLYYCMFMSYCGREDLKAQKICAPPPINSVIRMERTKQPPFLRRLPWFMNGEVFFSGAIKHENVFGGFMNNNARIDASQLPGKNGGERIQAAIDS